MSSRLIEIFEDQALVRKIQNRLPYLFQLAELESSRAGKIGMEVGSLREKIIIALFIYKFGENNIETQIPITEPEIDVKVFNRPVSIKTITGRSLSGVKLIWTVDEQKAKEFRENYSPTCDILLIQICWGKEGGFYYIPLEAQEEIFNEMGKERYIKLPKPGTNPRGVEITRKALEKLVSHSLTQCIKIYWQKQNIDYNPYKRWVEYWEE